jgi:hypothetical protein
MLRKHNNDGVAMDEPRQDSAKGLVYHSQNRAVSYRLSVLFKFIRLPSSFSTIHFKITLPLISRSFLSVNRLSLRQSFCM